MTRLLPAAAFAALFAFGMHGTAGAQAVDPSQPGSASGGVLARAAPGDTGAGREAMDEARIRDLLRERGYSDISEIARDGDAMTASARREGREVRLRVDPESGAVTQRDD